MFYPGCVRNILNPVMGNSFLRNLQTIRYLHNKCSRKSYLFNHTLFTNSTGGQKTSVNKLSKCLNLQHIAVRCMSQNSSRSAKHNQSVIIYICAAGIFMLGMSYAGVPLYRMFCQATGLGGKAVQGHDIDKVEKMTAVKDRILKIRFNADVASSMRWNFKPLQSEVKVLAGETALAFYTATNPSDKPVIGISTYNVVPFEAGQYFNKIQCFCFEEQRLNPHEKVDMPVFFYIDPEFVDDPKLEHVDTIILSYTFFEAKEGMKLPVPNFMAA